MGIIALVDREEFLNYKAIASCVRGPIFSPYQLAREVIRRDSRLGLIEAVSHTICRERHIKKTRDRGFVGGTCHNCFI